MGISMDKAFEVIKREREYQDRVWPRDDHPLVGQYKYAAPHLLMLEDYYEEARGEWTDSVDETDVLRTIGKMAAIAFRALTEVMPTHAFPPTEEQAFALVESARERQDSEHPRTKDNAGQYEYTAPHLFMLGAYLRRLGDRWYEGNRDRVIGGLVEITAICVRAMEEVDGPDLLFIGLRNEPAEGGS